MCDWRRGKSPFRKGGFRGIFHIDNNWYPLFYARLEGNNCNSDFFAAGSRSHDSKDILGRISTSVIPRRYQL